jgi:hypothetical protein
MTDVKSCCWKFFALIYRVIAITIYRGTNMNTEQEIKEMVKEFYHKQINCPL